MRPSPRRQLPVDRGLALAVALGMGREGRAEERGIRLAPSLETRRHNGTVLLIRYE